MQKWFGTLVIASLACSACLANRRLAGAGKQLGHCEALLGDAASP